MDEIWSLTWKSTVSYKANCWNCTLVESELFPVDFRWICWFYTAHKGASLSQYLYSHRWQYQIVWCQTWKRLWLSTTVFLHKTKKNEDEYLRVHLIFPLFSKFFACSHLWLKLQPRFLLRNRGFWTGWHRQENALTMFVPQNTIFCEILYYVLLFLYASKNVSIAV